MSAKPKKETMPGRRNLANAVRALSMDAVQKANSGHPRCPDGYGRHCRGVVERLYEPQSGES